MCGMTQVKILLKDNYTKYALPKKRVTKNITKDNVQL